MGNAFHTPPPPQSLFHSNMIDIDEFNNKYDITIAMLETKILKLEFKLENINTTLHKNNDSNIEFGNKINEMYKFCKRNRRQIDRNRSDLINNNINSDKLNHNINEKCYILSKKLYNIHNKMKINSNTKTYHSNDSNDFVDFEEYYKEYYKEDYKEDYKEEEENNDVFIDEEEYKDRFNSNITNSEKSIDSIDDINDTENMDSIDDKDDKINLKINLNNYNYEWDHYIN